MSRLGLLSEERLSDPAQFLLDADKAFMGGVMAYLEGSIGNEEFDVVRQARMVAMRRFIKMAGDYVTCRDGA